ncbi:Phage terminase, small subunit [Orenia metallireducens]|uniref:Phage terminase, small subunit n=1 Tax=Orenia metallireducens TaxID=1413210 RepID=A0A285GAC3_9FIRM|nr:P27 family phage terminase small subunit [Orenia metallireducens]SNY19361.1 Phage terminase, small subunit [Orenia metallireducens]
MISQGKLKESLLDQLKQSSKQGEQYEDLIDIYLDMRSTVIELTKNIEKAGVVVTYDNGGGQKGVKKNDSIDQRNKTINQMIKILNELNLEAKKDNGIPEL